MSKEKNIKTKTDRSIFLTDEVTNQLNTWIKDKHRTRRVCYQDKDDLGDKRTITEYRTLNIQKNDLYFLHIKVIKHSILSHCILNY
jgi:hypothetical protein